MGFGGGRDSRGRFTAGRNKHAQPRLLIHIETAKFTKLLTTFISNLRSTEAASSALLNVGMVMMRRVIWANPVDTGRSEAGWYFGINMVGKKIRGPQYTPRGAAQRQGFAKGTAKLKLRGFKKKIEITNAVVYVGALEYGWSQQAPFGMVRITMQVLRGSVPKIILKELQKMWDRDGVAKWSPWKASKDTSGAGRPTAKV